MRQAGVEGVVVGKRYGKDSSREHSVVAEAAAGVRLVIAESFERIYRQNADNVGLYTSTDLGLVERIARGEAIAIDELVAGRDALSASILRHGGLLPYVKVQLTAPARTVSSAAPGRCWPLAGERSRMRKLRRFAPRGEDRRAR